MGVGAYQGVGIGYAFAVGFVDEDYTSQIFEIYLVDDSGVGGDDGEVAEAGLAPAEEGVAFFVALELEQGVHVEGAGVPNSSTWTEWSITSSTGCRGLIRAGSPPSCLHGVAHGGEVDHAGDAGEILEEDAAGGEGDFFVGLGIFIPGGHRTHVFLLHVAAVFGAQQVLEQDAEAVGEMFGGDALLVERVEAVDFVFFFADFEGGAGVEAV